nr:reverse transcriptase domain-containing protein [Tanacetum cinerariifolium]
MINFIDITCEDRFPDVLKFKKSNQPSSGSTTPLSDFSPSLTPFKTSDSLLEEFADKLALLDSFPMGKEDNNFDFEADFREIEYLLNQDPSTESNIETIDLILMKFTDEPALDYLPPPGDDDNDLLNLMSDNNEWQKLFNSTLPEESSESSEIATLSSSPFGNEDKVHIEVLSVLWGNRLPIQTVRDHCLGVLLSKVNEEYLVPKMSTFGNLFKVVRQAQLVDTESELEEAPSEVEELQSLDFTTPLSPDHPLTHISPTPTPTRASFHRRTAAFRKRNRSSYETSSPSLTLRVRKRYRGTSKLILDTDSERDELGDKDIEEDENIDKEDKSEGQGLDDEERVSAFRQPILGTWIDPEDGRVYTDVSAYAPPVTPVQTPPSPEWLSSSMPISPSSLLVPSLIASLVATTTTTISVDDDQFIDIRAQLELHGSVLHDHTQCLVALPPTLIVDIDRDVREMYTSLPRKMEPRELNQVGFALESLSRCWSDLPVPDLRTMEELCQPTLNGRGGPIGPIAIQATNFGLKNDMIQQVQNSCQFYGLPGDDAKKHLDKFLHVTQSIKVNGVTDDALRLYLFPHSLIHHATAWFDCLPRNSITTF